MYVTLSKFERYPYFRIFCLSYLQQFKGFSYTTPTELSRSTSSPIFLHPSAQSPVMSPATTRSRLLTFSQSPTNKRYTPPRTSFSPHSFSPLNCSPMNSRYSNSPTFQMSPPMKRCQGFLDLGRSTPPPPPSIFSNYFVVAICTRGWGRLFS